MAMVRSTIRRKGKIVGRSEIVAGGPLKAEDIRAVAEEASRQAKADDIKRHTGKQGYRKKRPTTREGL